MAITKGAKRAIRVQERKRLFNLRTLRTLRDEVKGVKKLLESGKAEEANKKLPTAYKAIDKAAKRGVIKDNNAARKKSRLSAAIKKAKA